MAVTRADRHLHFQRERLAMARTPEQCLAAAFAWFRASAYRAGRRRGGSPSVRDRHLREAANWLAGRAAAIDRSD